MEERQEKQKRQQMEEAGHVSRRIRAFIIRIDGRSGVGCRREVCPVRYAAVLQGSDTHTPGTAGVMDGRTDE